MNQCHLPLTGTEVGEMLITDLGVYKIDRKQGITTLVELAPDVTVDEVRDKTEAHFEVSGAI